jgi:tRNA 2-selenouridine synthase
VSSPRSASGTRPTSTRAYLVGVEYSLRNIADQIKPLISRYTPRDRFLVYCFRGGKRSRLWADNLRTIGFKVDLLAGGWKNYRRWVREGWRCCRGP